MDPAQVLTLQPQEVGFVPGMVTDAVPDMPPQDAEAVSVESSVPAVTVQPTTPVSSVLAPPETVALPDASEKLTDAPPAGPEAMTAVDVTEESRLHR